MNFTTRDVTWEDEDYLIGFHTDHPTMDTTTVEKYAGRDEYGNWNTTDITNCMSDTVKAEMLDMAWEDHLESKRED